MRSRVILNMCIVVVVVVVVLIFLHAVIKAFPKNVQPRYIIKFNFVFFNA